MTATTAPLPGDYADVTVYATDLLVTAYPLAYSAEGLAEADAAHAVATPGALAVLERQVADDPGADVDDWFRASLRMWADRHDRTTP